MEKEIGSEAEMEEGMEEREEKKKGNEEIKKKQNRVNCASLFTLWSFIPVFKVHTRSITAAGTILVIPLFLPT